jgi:hypothetical protein
VAAWKLRDARFVPKVELRNRARRQTIAQPRHQPRPVEILAGAHVAHVNFHRRKGYHAPHAL